MKSKRTPLLINDFSGGLFTNPAQTDVDSKYTPDCLNVYAEGKSIRKRFGTNHINVASAGTVGNGIYNWVLNASQQYLMGLFDNNLKQMAVSGTTWSGTWTTVSPDSASGTAFSNALMHFVTYQGTLIMTTEARDKPQRMTTSDTSYKNIDFGGSGTAPFAKYCQIWKEHVWLLNIGAGGQLSEDATSLSGWTNQDVGTGLTSQTSLGGLATFRFHGGSNNGDNSQIKRTVSGMSTSYSVEIKTYFNTLGAVTSGDYAWLDVYNGTIRFRTRWSTDGVETFNGTTWLKVGVGLVTTGSWIVWKYLVTAGTATAAVVDVYKNGSPVGLQFSVANATTASNGQIQLTGNAGGSANRCDWYMDYLYILSITPRTNYYTDGLFNTWVGTTQATYTDNVLPTIPFLHFKLNDNAASNTVLNAGSSGNNGVANVTASTVNTSTMSVAGKISNAFLFNSANGNSVSIASADVVSVKADTTGTFSLWVNGSASNVDGEIFTLSNTTINSYFSFSQGQGGGDTLSFQVSSNGVTQLEAHVIGFPVSNTWSHFAIIQNGTAGPTFYVNGILTTTLFANTTNKAAWLAAVGGSFSTGFIGFAQASAQVFGHYAGKIDDVRYYRTALTSSEILTIYAEGNGNEGQPVTVQEGTTIYTGTYSYRVNNDGTYALINQTLSNGTALAGNSSIFGMWINATNNSTYKLRINDTITNYDSATFTANGTWQYQTLNFTPTSSAPSVFAQVISLSSATFIIDQVAITQSSTGTTQDFSDRLQRSASGTYDTWTGTDSGSNDITTPQDVGLTGSFILQDRMYITKAWNIYRITYTGSIPLLDIKQARSVVGTRSPRAVCNIDYPNYGEIVIFLGTDRNLYLFDGFSSTPLTDDVSLNNNMAQVYFNNINTQALDKIFAVNHSNLGCYEIFLPMGNATVPNFSMFYNYRTKAFWPFDNRNFLSGRNSDDASGQRVIVVAGASNGIVYEINSDKATSDDGSAINAYWNSFKLGEDYVLGRQDQIQIACDSVTATPTFKWRSNYETTYITKTLAASSNQNVYDPAREANLIQFQVGDNSTGAIWKIWHIKALERGLGIGG